MAREDRPQAMTPDELRRLDMDAVAEVQRQVEERKATEMPGGGRYKTADGRTVDFDGKEAK